jgi:hypothetical protein
MKTAKLFINSFVSLFFVVAATPLTVHHEKKTKAIEHVWTTVSAGELGRLQFG